MTRLPSLLAHGAALMLALLGLALWEQHGVRIVLSAVPSFCF
jgi:hypothetical protein